MTAAALRSSHCQLYARYELEARDAIQPTMKQIVAYRTSLATYRVQTYVRLSVKQAFITGRVYWLLDVLVTCRLTNEARQVRANAGCARHEQMRHLGWRRNRSGKRAIQIRGLERGYNKDQIKETTSEV